LVLIKGGNLIDIYIPYVGAIHNINLGAKDVVSTGIATFGTANANAFIASGHISIMSGQKLILDG